MKTDTTGGEKRNKSVKEGREVYKDRGNLGQVCEV